MNKPYSIFQKINTEQEETECMDSAEQARFLTRFKNNVSREENRQTVPKKRAAFGSLKLAAALCIAILTGTTGIALAANGILEKWHSQNFINYELPENLPDGINFYYGEPIDYNIEYQMGVHTMHYEGTILGYHLDANGLLYLLFKGGFMPGGAIFWFHYTLNDNPAEFSATGGGDWNPSDLETEKLVSISLHCTALSSVTDEINLFVDINNSNPELAKTIKLGTFHVTDPACRTSVDSEGKEMVISRFGITMDEGHVFLQKVNENMETRQYASQTEKLEHFNYYTFYYKDGSSDRVRTARTGQTSLYRSEWLSAVWRETGSFPEFSSRYMVNFQVLRDSSTEMPANSSLRTYCIDVENLVKITDDFGWELVFDENGQATVFETTP